MKSMVMIVGLAITWAAAYPAAAQVTADFDLRLAPTEVDAILNPGETLDLDVFLRLSSASPLPNVTGWSAFFNLDPSEDSVLSFTGLFFDQLGFSTVLPNGSDNSSESGDFGRSLLATPLTLPANTWLLAARFRVLALTPGSPQSVDYAFTDAPPQRPWSVALDGGGFASVSMNSSPLITVTPEPSTGLLLLVVAGLASSRKRRRRAGT